MKPKTSISIFSSDTYLPAKILSLLAFAELAFVDKSNKIVGVITDGDLRRNISYNFLDMKACEVMTKHPKLVSAEMFAQEATKMMNDNKITNLFVSENGMPTGIIHIHDCLRAGLA